NEGESLGNDHGVLSEFIRSRRTAGVGSSAVRHGGRCRRPMPNSPRTSENAADKTDARGIQSAFRGQELSPNFRFGLIFAFPLMLLSVPRALQPPVPRVRGRYWRAFLAMPGLRNYPEAWSCPAASFRDTPTDLASAFHSLPRCPPDRVGCHANRS